MSDRKGVVLLMFDLPMTTSDHRRVYSHFKKALRLQGFLPLQESCYIKLIRNVSAFPAVLREIKQNLPKEGTVHVLPMGHSQFSEMQCLCGNPYDLNVFGGDLFVIGEETDETSAG